MLWGLIPVSIASIRWFTVSSWLSRQPAYRLSRTSTELPARLAISGGETPALSQALSAAWRRS
jgi:hypothetical protein